MADEEAPQILPNKPLPARIFQFVLLALAFGFLVWMYVHQDRNPLIAMSWAPIGLAAAAACSLVTPKMWASPAGKIAQELLQLAVFLGMLVGGLMAKPQSLLDECGVVIGGFGLLLFVFGHLIGPTAFWRRPPPPPL